MATLEKIELVITIDKAPYVEQFNGNGAAGTVSLVQADVQASVNEIPGFQSIKYRFTSETVEEF